MTQSRIDRQSVNSFIRRHIGPRVADQAKMLELLGLDSLEALENQVVPKDIQRPNDDMDIAYGISEVEALEKLESIANKNKIYRSLIGMGYYDTHVPNVIMRNIFENPGWYTSYTPYQPEISQGRLEALMNFQTMVSDLTGFEIANASLLDEATAAAEAMAFCHRVGKSKSDNFFVSDKCHPQTIAVVKTRATHLGFNVIVGNPFTEMNAEDVFGVLLQYPDTYGAVEDFREVIASVQANKGKAVMAADLMALTLLTPPAELGADVAIGTTQRFGVPLGFGGPHAAYMATTAKAQRSLPGRIVGASVDSRGKPAYRLALQTREQHIRREKATSNICTAQALLAIMAGMYAVYHGADKLKEIASRINQLTARIKVGLDKAGLNVVNATFFDTITVDAGSDADAIYQRAQDAQVNLRREGNLIGFSIDEVTDEAEALQILQFFAPNATLPTAEVTLPENLLRSSDFLTHPVFKQYHSETSMMRYIRNLCDKDLALDRTMIPLGSCTMKLNAASEMIPVGWKAFNNIHPFAPLEQSEGYREMITDLEKMLCECTGYAAMSLQPNSGAQGEYAGLLTINAYHASRGEGHRNICLIPSSAHGTNPASAALANMKVVVVKCDEGGNVDVADLREKAEQHKDNLAAIMITYPSTHGVFETAIREICQIVHDNGGQVYLDGANLAAQVGLAGPGLYGSDVSHLNLHKTFAIPHGGGGPGVGPIGVAKHLVDFLPNHNEVDLGKKGEQVSAAPWGSAGVLPIVWMYISMMGREGLTEASLVAILSANYLAKRLSEKYDVLYTDANGFVAHECIIDTREFKEFGVEVDDIAKRLMDFGFHAPTMSFPVPGTLMIEPTESESLAELERFCEAMLRIHDEIMDVKNGKYPADNNPLSNAPHTIDDLADNDWTRPYPRMEAVYPVDSLRLTRYFTPVNRVDNAYGDRNLVCTCPPLSAWENEDA